MSEYNSENDLKRYKYCFYALTSVAFLVLAYGYIRILFFQIPFFRLLPGLVISLSMITALCVIYTCKGIFHKLYNPDNKLMINFQTGLFFGIFSGYFILYYGDHYVHPSDVLLTYKNDIHWMILAFYIGLSICVGLSILTTLSKSKYENSKGVMKAILQRKYRVFEIIYLVLILFSFLILLNEFTQMIPTHKTKLYGSLYFSPTLFSLPVMVFTILEYRKRKNSLSKIGLCIGILMFFWFWFFMDIGYLLLGP